MRESDYLTIAEFLDIIKDLPPSFTIAWKKFGNSKLDFVGLTKDDVIISHRNSLVGFTFQDAMCDYCERGNCEDCDRIDPDDCDRVVCKHADLCMHFKERI